jgi:hypothetical protein
MGRQFEEKDTYERNELKETENNFTMKLGKESILLSLLFI